MTDLHDRFRSLDRVRAPDLWSEVTQRASVAAERPSRLPWAMSRTVRLSLVLIALLILVSLGIVAVGGLLRDERTLPDGFLSYEAVFLRLEVVDGSREVVVVGVNAERREREIARLPGAWAVYEIDGGDYLAPMGAVSPSGLLAMPSSRGDVEELLPTLHWEIFDLHSPQAEPIVIAGISQEIEQLRLTPSFYTVVDGRGGVFWGPGERLAIAWYERVPDPNDSSAFGVDRQLSFVEGRTGAATSLDVAEDLAILPSWASDGSGVLIGSAGADLDHRGVLHPDGTEAEASAAVPISSCRTRSLSGAEIAVSARGIERTNPDGSRDELLSGDGIEFAGGIGFACLAPDDSMIVHNTEIGAAGGSITASGPKAGLIDPGSGAWFEIDGSFAGWLEVDR